MTRYLLRNGRVIDPSQGLDRQTSLLIEAGKIVGYDVASIDDGEIVDCDGMIVSPGLIDLQTELREPGFEEDETIFTGTLAALAGGFTTIVCSSNTDPPLDSPASVEFVHQKAARADHCHVLVTATLSKNREGEQLAEIGTLVEAGAVAFSDGPKPVDNPGLLRRALQYCSMFDKTIFSHTESKSLSGKGVMHEGLISTILGLPSMPAAAEDVMTARDLRLAEITGGKLHFSNVSSGGSVEQIRRHRARGVAITAGICPQNFTLNDENLRTFDSNYKVNPPLRSQKHVDACLAGLADGTIDVISSGHQPRAIEKKMRELDLAPFGMVGLETTLALVIQQLIEPGHLSWSDAIAALTINPATVVGLSGKGTLKVGADADIAIIDPAATWTLDPTGLHSKSANTPFSQWQFRGRVVQTFVSGKSKYQLGVAA